MVIINLIRLLLSAFFGYLVGRWGDNYLNFWLKDPSWAPHHWIYGLILMTAGFFFLKDNLELYVFFFGAGLFISDLKDFLDFKFIGKDNKTRTQRRFWNID